VLEAVQNPQAMRQRRETGEHPFATLKMRMSTALVLSIAPLWFASPSAAIIDSQSVKSVEKEAMGSSGEEMASIVADVNRWSAPCPS
jgi:hypothetical protein